MSNRLMRVSVDLSCASVMLCATVVLGRQPAPTPAPPVPPSEAPAPSDNAAAPAPTAPAAQPGLDELLGIAPSTVKPEDGVDAGAAVADPSTKQLERRLSGQEEQQMLLEAVTEMGDVAERIRAARDVGLQTQRLQQSVIVKLDALIRSQQSKQSQSSSSSSSSQPQNQDAQSQAQQQARQQSQAQQQQGEATQAGNDGENALPGGPAFEQGRKELLSAAAAAWGALPARVRDVLLESVGEQYSDMYRVQTEAYYRRLAEQEQK